MAEPIIRLEHVTRTYHVGDIDVHALRDVSLKVNAGEFVAIMGSSGSGKSTLMAVLGCLDRPSSGSYFFEGADVANLSEPERARLRSERLGFVFQSFNLLSRTSALENVQLPMLYAGVPRRELARRAAAALERVGLGTRVHHRPSELSGGQQQRVAIARALVNRPRVILADDSVLFRDLLASALEGRGHRIVAQVGDAPSLLAAVAQSEADVALVDIRMPPGSTSGLDAGLEIRRRWRRTAVLVLSQYVETIHVASLLGDDASGVGYLLKDRVANVAELDAAISRIVAGGSAVDPAVVAAWLGRPRMHSPLDELTGREREVLSLMAEGRSNSATADALGLTIKTVESHVASIFSKLGLEPAESDHRRVLAVVTWLQSDQYRPPAAGRRQKG